MTARVTAPRIEALAIAGSGDVRYFGEPTVRQAIVGSGSVRRARAAHS